jgi:hypothetical protein
MEQPDATPSKHQCGDTTFSIWPRIDRETIAEGEWTSDLPEDEQDLLDYQEARFHDTREVRVEKELTGWIVSSEGESTWLGPDEYPEREDVIEAVKERLE